MGDTERKCFIEEIPDETVLMGQVVSEALFVNEETVQSVCSSAWIESEFDKPSLFFLLSDTASSTLYFLAPPL
ncbi:hypothetical protein NQZ68_007608 [Dissostichus eleginoides]|nr:hypothetical protein NQZ68_007608 [Dissostichus eleginoides]